MGDLDSALFHAQHTKYLVAAGGGRWHNLSLRLDTTEVRGHRLRARAQLVWPQLLNRRRLRFGVTQVNPAAAVGHCPTVRCWQMLARAQTLGIGVPHVF